VYKPTANSSAHLNQKPLEFMERIVRTVTDPGDVVWEPFAALATQRLRNARIAASRLIRTTNARPWKNEGAS
ncbi:MAG: hypothetical protein ACRDQX_08765, partial [Pseudonocardiaceae bacterium]